MWAWTGAGWTDVKTVHGIRACGYFFRKLPGTGLACLRESLPNCRPCYEVSRPLKRFHLNPNSFQKVSQAGVPEQMMPSGNARAVLGGFLLLFVASRLLYVVLIDPNYVLIHLGEELYRGAIAEELVTGLKMPFTEYRADNYSGGSLVIGALASGFFLLFGPTVFALKLAPLFLFTLALVFWYWTIERAAGERVARYFAVLFCFSPPLFTAYSVTAMGFHSESIFFSALTGFLLFRMLSDETGSLAFAALLGLTTGFGLWFTYIYGLTLLALLGFWVWYDKGILRLPRVLWFALGFGMGFSPWIVINVQTHFAGLVIYDMNVWEHFGLAYLWDGLAHPRRLAPVEFFVHIASDDTWDLYRRAVNLLYSLLYLGPILTAGVLRMMKTGRSAPAGVNDRGRGPRETRPSPTHPTRPTLVGVAILSAKGYAYGFLPWAYLYSHTPAGPDDPKVIAQLVQRPLLSDILPKLSSEDQRELSRVIALMLARKAPLNGEPGEFFRIERVVPPGFDRYFYYWLGGTAMGQHPNKLPKAFAAVEFLHHRSPAAHHMALVGIYRSWPLGAALDSSPEALLNSPAPVAPELSPHYWRALGQLAGRYWYETERSLSLLNAHLQAFVPRLD